jgi:hypothetical protein
MRLPRLAAAAALAAALLAPSSAPWAHGASRGLHLHVNPDPVRPGAVLRVEVNAAKRLSWLKVGVVDDDAVEVVPEHPTRKLVQRIRVPRTVSGTLSVQAEGRLLDGKTVRAAAVVRVRD